MNRRLLVTALAGMLVVAGMVFAETSRHIMARMASTVVENEQDRGQGSGHPFGFGGIARVARELGLTEDQKSRIKEVIISARSNNSALFDRLRSDHQALQGAVFSGGGADAVNAAVPPTLTSDIAKLIDAGMNVKQSVFAILTPDQQTKLKSLIGSFGARMEQNPGGNSVGENRGQAGEKLGSRAVVAHLAQELGLTDEQKERIQTVISEHKNNTAVFETLKNDRQAVIGAIINDRNVNEAVPNLAGDIANLIVDRAQLEASIFAQLTPEQQNKFKTMRGGEGRMGPGFGIF